MFLMKIRKDMYIVIFFTPEPPYLFNTVPESIIPLR